MSEDATDGDGRSQGNVLARLLRSEPVESINFTEASSFPLAELARLHEMMNRRRWIVPVLPKGELDVLLQASIELTKSGLDTYSETCQWFYKDGLNTAFTKVLTDENLTKWKIGLHVCIMKSCELLLELCVMKLTHDCFPLLELLEMVFNPDNKFHTFNGTRPPLSVMVGSETSEEDEFAQNFEPSQQKTWLVDLINKFGKLGGFDVLLQRFQSGTPLTVPVIAALIKPFGMCYKWLTVQTVGKYLVPIAEIVSSYLDKMTDEELKKGAVKDMNKASVFAILHTLKSWTAMIPNQEATMQKLESLHLKKILSLLQISDFNGKLMAIMEINKMISNVSCYEHGRAGPEKEYWITKVNLLEWIRKNKVLQTALKTNRPGLQYLEQLENILKFIIRERSLTLKDLDDIWSASSGMSRNVSKNIYSLLSKFAWDFSNEQLLHLYELFKSGWYSAKPSRKKELLDFVWILAENDKNGDMADQVLIFLWTMADLREDVPAGILNHMLFIQIKLLEYSCIQDKHSRRIVWIEMFLEELKVDKPGCNNTRVLQALKQITKICKLYARAPAYLISEQKRLHMCNRHEFIQSLKVKNSIVNLVANDLECYMEKIHLLAKERLDLDSNVVLPDWKSSHNKEIQERLDFLSFILEEGWLWLCYGPAEKIWTCLVENAVYDSDREACFKWFIRLMDGETDFDPEKHKEFFDEIVLKLDPYTLTENGVRCFERFFKYVNSQEGKLIEHEDVFQMNDPQLLGLDYLWKVALCESEDSALRAMEILKEIYTNFGPKLIENKKYIQKNFLQTCMDHVKQAHEIPDLFEEENTSQLRLEVTRAFRIMKCLHQYVTQFDECDGENEETTVLTKKRDLPESSISLGINFTDLKVSSLGDSDIQELLQDTIGSVRRQILSRMKEKKPDIGMDLFLNGQLLDITEDRRSILKLAGKDEVLVSKRLFNVLSAGPSSSDSSSSDSESE